MAITTNTFKINAGFARSDILTQLESAFNWLGWNAGTLTGICTGISVYSGGGTVGSSADTYEDVRQTSTSGIGTGASFYITRSSGNINRVMVNRPGYGYTDGEVVTLSSEYIGTAAAGASDLSVTVNVEGGETPVGYGSTASFYDSDTSGDYPWAVQRHTIQENKIYGDTYRAFQVISGNTTNAHTIRVTTGSAFQPYDSDNTSDRGHYYGNMFKGERYLDIPTNTISNGSYTYMPRLSSSNLNYCANNASDSWTVSGSSSYDLDLNVYRSSIDSNFAVFSYKHPDLSSTHLTSNSYDTFILHNFTSNLWDYDNVFLGGVTMIDAEQSTPRLVFRTYPSVINATYYQMVDRSAESGYYLSADSSHYLGNSNSRNEIETMYYPTTYGQTNTNDQSYLRAYIRNNQQDFSGIGGNADYNAVIKGIPLSAMMIPCPYYLPDDFVLINFDYGSPSANIQQGDTVTISGSEVYTVITGVYDQTSRTRGILFCARTT